jgi:hypothetical protein
LPSIVQVEVPVDAFIMILPQFLRISFFSPIWSHLTVLTWTPIQPICSLTASRLPTSGGAGRKSGVAPRFSGDLPVLGVCPTACLTCVGPPLEHAERAGGVSNKGARRRASLVQPSSGPAPAPHSGRRRGLCPSARHRQLRSNPPDVTGVIGVQRAWSNLTWAARAEMPACPSLLATLAASDWRLAAVSSQWCPAFVLVADGVDGGSRNAKPTG